MSNFPNIPGEDLDGFLDQLDSEDKYPPIDIRINQPINKNLESDVLENLESSFLESNIYDISKREGKKEEDYLSSEYRKQKYKNISEKDIEFNRYLKGIYGSAENFLEMNYFLIENKTYDPNYDYMAEVEIITQDTFFKSPFISSLETTLELIDGICTVEYFKISGNIDRLVCSLSPNIIPESQTNIRSLAFYGLPNNRILVWNIIKQKWSSFYMKNLKRFVRDDTSGIK